MAIEEETFYNILGEEINRSNLVNEMINYYALKLEAGETRVTDFNEGSEIRNLLEAIAVDLYYLMEDENELSKIGFIDTAEGEWLDKHGANPFIDLPRDTGSEAEGYVIFSIPEASTADIVIPEDTVVVSEETGLEFGTQGEGLIPAGETSVTVSVTCLTTGTDGNAEIGEVTLIDDDYLDLPQLTVTNDTAFTGGIDYEEDDEYRERLLAHIRQDDFGSIGYYTELGNNVDGVHDVYLIDDTNEVYTKIVLVNGNVKETPTTVLNDVLATFTDTNNIVVGHTFSVSKPDYSSVSLSISLTVDETLDSEEIKDVVKAVFNGGDPVVGISFEGLSIGETLTRFSIESALGLFDGVESISIIHGSSEMTDITPDSDEVLVPGTITVTQTLAT